MAEDTDKTPDEHQDDEAVQASVEAEVVSGQPEIAGTSEPPPDEPARYPELETEADRREDEKAGLPKDVRQYAMFCHLGGLASYVVPFGGVLAPLILWQIKKDEHPFIDEQGKSALNFNITVAIAICVCIALSFVLIGFVLLPIVAIGSTVFSIIAGLKVNDGERYSYPFTLNLVK